MERLYALVCLHKPFVQQATRINLRDYATHLHALRLVVASILVLPCIEHGVQRKL